MSLTFLSAADVHLGRSSALAGSYASISARIGWERLIQQAIDIQADAVLLSGDLVDKENNYFEALSALETQLKRLENHKIHAVIVAGNHDALVLPEMVQTFNRSDFVHFLGIDGNWELLKIEFKNGDSAQFIGWSFPSEHIFENPLANLSIENLSVEPDMPLIGLVHGEVTRSDSNYAPISLSSLQQVSEVDAWLLGHIHAPQIFQLKDPFICYTGSLQALSAKERGAHGFEKLEIIEGGLVQHELISVSPVRYEKVEIEISSAFHQNEIRQHIAAEIAGNSPEFVFPDLEYLVLDISLTGEIARPHEVDTWLNQSDILDYETSVNHCNVTIRKITNHTRYKADNLHLLAEEKSPAGILASAILDLEKDRESTFALKLLESFKERTQEINNSSVYQPLDKQQKIATDTSEHRQLLIDECHRLLSEMIILKQNAKN